MYQWMVLMNLFAVAGINSLSVYYQENWNTNGFLWNYFIVQLFLTFVYAYWDMPKKPKNK